MVARGRAPEAMSHESFLETSRLEGDPTDSVGNNSLGKYRFVRRLKVGGTPSIYLAVVLGEPASVEKWSSKDRILTWTRIPELG